jgi:uncharacterized membrane protein
MRDRITQIVLGVFVATFLYCLLVLRTIRGQDHEPFVPQISVTVGVVLSLISLSLLIYFIHHVSISIHIGEIISRVQDELLAAIDEVFPETLGQGIVEAPHNKEQTINLPDFVNDGVPVLAEASGYLEAVDDDKLLELTKSNGFVVRLDIQPGDFVLPKQTVMMVGPKNQVDDEAIAALRGSLLLGSQRTPVQDVMFALERQADIAIRALSPGINDPLTAIDCLERLTEALDRLAARRLPSAHRFDDKGNLRVVAAAVSFTDLLAASIGLVREYTRDSAIVTIKVIDVLARLAQRARRDADRQALREQLNAIACCPHEQLSIYDRERVRTSVECAQEAF